MIILLLEDNQKELDERKREKITTQMFLIIVNKKTSLYFHANLLQFDKQKVSLLSGFFYRNNKQLSARHAVDRLTCP